MTQLDRIEAVLCEQELSNGAKLLYCLLESLDIGREFTISNRKLARKLGVSMPTLIKYRRELENKGYVEVKNEKSEDGIFSVNTYTLLRRSK